MRRSSRIVQLAAAIIVASALAGCNRDASAPAQTPVPTSPPKVPIASPVATPSGVLKTPRPVPTPSPYPDGAGSDLVLKDNGLGRFHFRRLSQPIIDEITKRLGPPTSDTHKELVPYSPGPYDGGMGPYADDRQDPSYTWDYPAWRQTCWQMLCTRHARFRDGSLRFVEWKLYAAYEASNPNKPSPNLRTQRGLGIGTTWSDIKRLYPGATFARGEGAMYLYDLPWPETKAMRNEKTGRLETKSDPHDCGYTGSGYNDCAPAPDARVLSVEAGEPFRFTCC